MVMVSSVTLASVHWTNEAHAQRVELLSLLENGFQPVLRSDGSVFLRSFSLSSLSSFSLWSHVFAASAQRASRSARLAMVLRISASEAASSSLQLRSLTSIFFSATRSWSFSDPSLSFSDLSFLATTEGLPSTASSSSTFFSTGPVAVLATGAFTGREELGAPQYLATRRCDKVLLTVKRSDGFFLQSLEIRSLTSGSRVDGNRRSTARMSLHVVSLLFEPKGD
mmetsp:Transcript_82552/g.145681  ORF Transcript_82552/g.145681 Transcript_82552/m.145681 type:complete len:224 (-) Transcript_82552:649-1320(-)